MAGTLEPCRRSLTLGGFACMLRAVRIYTIFIPMCKHGESLGAQRSLRNARRMNGHRSSATRSLSQSELIVPDCSLSNKSGFGMICMAVKHGS